MSLGEKIKLNRTRLKLKQEDLGKRLHVSRQTISNWEVGRSYPDIESLIALSDMFDLSLDKLLKEDINMISSLKKRPLGEVSYISFMISLTIGGIITAIVDMALNHTLTWSLIVLAACLLSGTFITVFKHTSSYYLIKASISVFIPGIILFWSIYLAIPTLNFIRMLQIGTFWFIFFILIVCLIELSKIRFWNLLMIITLISIPLELVAEILVDETALDIASVISVFSNFALAIIFFAIERSHLDKNKMDTLLSKFRKHTQQI